MCVILFDGRMNACNAAAQTSFPNKSFVVKVGDGIRVLRARPAGGEALRGPPTPFGAPRPKSSRRRCARICLDARLKIFEKFAADNRRLSSLLLFSVSDSPGLDKYTPKKHYTSRRNAMFIDFFIT